MRPLKRKPVFKKKSVQSFRRHARRTKGANVQPVMRGGIRF